MNPVTITDIIAGTKIVGSLGAIGGGIRWGAKVLTQFTRMADNVEKIMNNHLPHLEKAVGDLKDAFNAHLLEVAKKDSE
jgi:hypothetical protein